MCVIIAGQGARLSRLSGESGTRGKRQIRSCLGTLTTVLLLLDGDDTMLLEPGEVQTVLGALLHCGGWVCAEDVGGVDIVVYCSRVLASVSECMIVNEPLGWNSRKFIEVEISECTAFQVSGASLCFHDLQKSKVINLCADIVYELPAVLFVV